MSRTIGNTLGASLGAREGCVEIVHTYPFSFNTPGILTVEEGIEIDQIQASTDQPVELELSIQILTGFDDSTANDVQVGTTGVGSELLGISDPDTTIAGYYPAANAVAKARITSNTTIYLSYGPGAGDQTQGSGVLIVKEFFQNILPVV